jgi:hypothetical protein
MPPPEPNATLETTRLIHWRTWNRDGEEWLVLRFPFSRSVVNALKAEFPWEERRWAPELKAWLVHSRHGEFALQILEQFFPLSSFCTSPDHPSCFRIASRGRISFASPCAVWRNFDSLSSAYTTAQDLREQQYLKDHPKAEKKTYGVPLGTDGPKIDESVPEGPRRRRTMHLD